MYTQTHSLARSLALPTAPSARVHTRTRAHAHTRTQGARASAHEEADHSPLIAGSEAAAPVVPWCGVCRGCSLPRDQTTGLILLITCLLFMDQNLLAPNLTAAARDFGFSDVERDTKLGGEISLSLFLVGAPFSLLVGFLADRVHRCRLYAAVVLLGEVGCFLVVFVHSYWEFFCLRALTGIALGGAVPLVFSMVSDMYSPDERPTISALVGIAMGVGIAFGQGLAAVVGEAYGWRAPFALVAVPSCVTAVVFALVATEPERGAQDAAAARAALDAGQGVEGGAGGEGAEWKGAPEDFTCSDMFRRVFSVPSNVFIFVQGIPGCIPWGVISVFLNDFLAVDRGAPSALAAVSVCAAWALGTLTGIVVGGWWGQKILKSAGPSDRWGRGPETRHYICYLMAASTALAVIPLLLILNLEFSLTTLAPIAVLGGFLSGIAGPNVRAVLLNVNTPDIRASVFGVFAVTDDIGKGLGPPIIAMLVRAFGRAVALNVGCSLWLACAGLLLALSRTMVADEARVQRAVLGGEEEVYRPPREEEEVYRPPHEEEEEVLE